MEVYWVEQTAADVPPENDWLSAAEVARLDLMRFPKRRTDWRLGRWTAKRALSAYWNVPGDRDTLAGIELRPAPSGAPDVFRGERRAAVTLSLSHRGGRAVCALAGPGVALGCDLEMVEPHSAAFAADYFTLEEQAWVARAPASDHSRLLTLLWSGKESVLKALRLGLRMDTRCLTVGPVDGWAENPASTWRRLDVRGMDGRIFCGWWRSGADFVRTLVGAPAPAAPIEIPYCTTGSTSADGRSRS